MENGTLQGVGVKTAIRGGVVCDETFDSLDTDLCSAVRVWESH